MAVLPYVASETLLRGFMGQPPFLFCGGSSYWDCTALATNNESAMRNGRPKGKANRTADLKRGFVAFRRVQDSNGIPDRDDAARIQKAMFPDLPTPASFVTRNAAEAEAKMKAGYALSVALRLSALPASSPLRKYTAADHQVTIHSPKGNLVRRIDPMHPWSPSRYIGEMVPLEHVWKAAKAIGDGSILAWAYPIGGWTQARLKTVALRAENKALETKVDGLTEKVTTLKTDLIVMEREKARLTRELEECERMGGNCEEQLKAQAEAIADRIHELEEEVREAA